MGGSGVNSSLDPPVPAPAERILVSWAADQWSYFQWPPCSGQTWPMLLHLRQVSFPNIPDARPSSHPWQS